MNCSDFSNSCTSWKKTMVFLQFLCENHDTEHCITVALNVKKFFSLSEINSQLNQFFDSAVSTGL